jgi:hypothetical protein
MEGRRAVGAPTIAQAFRLTVADHPDRIAVRTLNDETSSDGRSRTKYATQIEAMY